MGYRGDHRVGFGSKVGGGARHCSQAGSLLFPGLLQAVRIGNLKLVPEIDMTPTMTVRISSIQVAVDLRLCLGPVLEDLPLLKGMSVSVLDEPTIDFDVRVLGGPDFDVPPRPGFLDTGCLGPADHVRHVVAQENCDPLFGERRWRTSPSSPLLASWLSSDVGPQLDLNPGQVLEAELQPRFSPVLRVALPTDAYVSAVIGCPGERAETGEQEGKTRAIPDSTHPEWGESFNLVVADHLQRLCINVLHDNPKRLPSRTELSCVHAPVLLLCALALCAVLLVCALCAVFLVLCSWSVLLLCTLCSWSLRKALALCSWSVRCALGLCSVLLFCALR
eukprot:jgi/Botrbrau1/8227/Bobra.0392s0023.1